ncbi:uncharacterized protein LOC132269996 [Cornus florida]|uniref:uncharacterized protein LOC132269996 n=1 Tax=Cornus florida TaxID=4283 RepID=UPI0028991F64|nr:uncharacterized protein LOC132269996 [Cornus florida]
MPPRKKQPLKLYISAADESIGSLLAQDNEVGKEQAVYYLSRILTPVERRYTPIEKMCLALYFAAHKLRIYMLLVLVYVICATDLIKYMLSRPIISGRIGKWSLALMEFSFQYVPQRAVKGQALADFLADHPCLDVDPGVYDAMELCAIQLTPWTLIFDGSSANDVGGARVVIIAPNGRKTTYSFFLDFKCSNNQAEYEALIIGLEILLEMGAQTVEIIGDSSLVIGQLSSNFKCQSWHLKPFHSIAMQLLQEFAEVKVKHVYRLHNKEANDLAQIASGVRVPEGIMENLIRIKRRSLPSVKVREELLAEVFAIKVEEDMEENDWRTPIVNFLKNPDPKANKKLKIKALKFVMIDGDLFRKSIKDDLLLRCVSKKEAMKVMGETHEGICGAHQAGIKMKWLIRRYAYYWPGMLKDCITYARGCQACQRHGPIHRAPAIELQPIIKPWPFRGWAMDLIGKVYPPSSKQHCFIIVATDYFTKWVEAVPMKSVHQEDVIRFIKQHVIHRFGIPESITTDRGSALVAKEVQAFAAEYGIKLLNSTPHFAQGNGQAETSNKTLKGIIEKNVLPMEVTVRSMRFALQNNLTPAEYNESMLVELEDLDEVRLRALDHIQVQKRRVARVYNKRVRAKIFDEGDLVWKTVLPMGMNDRKYGKWSPNWEGPFMIYKVLKGGAYHLQDLDGERHPRPINGRYLKTYYPTMWETMENKTKDG